MLAKRVSELPVDGDWIFEPKWDGFRALVFRDGDEILIQSRDEKPLNRYFPDLLEPLRSAQEAGLKTVMFDSDQGKKAYLDCAPDYTITDLRDLLGILGI